MITLIAFTDQSHTLSTNLSTPNPRDGKKTAVMKEILHRDDKVSYEHSNRNVR